MVSTIKKTYSISSRFDQVYDEPRKCTWSTLESDFRGKEVRRSQLFTKYLPPNFSSARTAKRLT